MSRSLAPEGVSSKPTDECYCKLQLKHSNDLMDVKGSVMAKILIVEDDADLVETYTDLLEVHDHSVKSVARANDAIALVTNFKPNIVLLDLNLAGYSGAIVINIIRGYSVLKDTKIVVITGHPEMLKGNPNATLVDLVLSKPISNEELLSTVETFIVPAS